MDTLRESFRTLNVRSAGSVLHVALDRNHVLNAVNFEMALDLHRVLDALQTLQQEKREDVALEFSCMVLECKGGCVGVDLRAADEDDDWDYSGIHSQQLLSSLVEKLYRLPLIVICVADGPVVGLGLGLWLASDLRLATTRSSFRCGFSRIGISNCDMAVSWLLPHVVGYSTASRMMLLHDTLSAKEARSRDLAHFVDEDHRAAMARVQEVVAKLGDQHSVQGLPLTKKQLKTSLEGNTSLSQAVVAENAIQVMLLARGDVMHRARTMLAGLRGKSKL